MHLMLASHLMLAHTKSFVTTGLLHRQTGYSDSQFVACLNPRLKELLFITDQSNFIRDKSFLNIITFDYAFLDALDAMIKPYIDIYQKSALEFFKNKLASRSRIQQRFDPLIEFHSMSVGNVLNVVSPLNGFGSMDLAPPMENGSMVLALPMVNGSMDLAPPMENGSMVLALPMINGSMDLAPPMENGSMVLAPPMVNVPMDMAGIGFSIESMLS